jgi:hypothetical protein
MKLVRFALAAVAVAVSMLALSAGSAFAIGCKTEYEAPTASFDYSPGTPTAGSPVSFDASSSTPGSFTSYSYDAQAEDCVFADSGSVGISTYTWQWGDGTANTTGTATPQHTFANPGTYTVVLTVGAGTAGTDSTSRTIKTAWTVAVTAPTVSANETQNYKRGALTLAATAAGPEAVKRVEFYVRGVKVGEDTSAPYSMSYNTAAVADGSADIYVRAVGVSDTATNSPTKTVIFDNTAPAFTILEGSPVVKPGQDRFLVRFTDAGWMYGNPLCWADSAEPVDWDYCIGAGVQKTFEGAYTFALPEGQHTVYFRGSDAAGNQTTGSATVTVDGTPPDPPSPATSRPGRTSRGRRSSAACTRTAAPRPHSARALPRPTASRPAPTATRRSPSTPRATRTRRPPCTRSP